MSKESALQLLQAAASDEALLQTLESGDEGAIARVAEERGMSVTLEELKAAAEDCEPVLKEGELSDEDLEKVAGGMVIINDMPAFQSFTRLLGGLTGKTIKGLG